MQSQNTPQSTHPNHKEHKFLDTFGRAQFVALTARAWSRFPQTGDYPRTAPVSGSLQAQLKTRKNEDAALKLYIVLPSNRLARQQMETPLARFQIASGS